ncbi:hypothetical protein DUI87_16529 [Hirundo rustica rustica]|uniref:Uncharacterized protein n=1 Tax=Hirundo rustica rustica TaxID=333673 RepID=A0A3M0K1N8_HIRRU|nr:hypothetical protein DUI87_16529 [Hirundo rustica rustica]
MELVKGLQYKSDLVEEGKEVNIVYIDVSKTLDTVSQKFLIETVDVWAGGEDSRGGSRRGAEEEKENKKGQKEREKDKQNVGRRKKLFSRVTQIINLIEANRF